jgi:hypothetical protein
MRPIHTGGHTLCAAFEQDNDNITGVLFGHPGTKEILGNPNAIGAFVAPHFFGGQEFTVGKGKDAHFGCKKGRM